MSLTLITPATSSPVTPTEVKRYLGIEGSTFDELIEDLLAAAIAQVETLTGRALGSQVWKLVLDAFTPTIVLPRGPVTALSSVSYFDPSGDLQIVDPGTYTLDLVSDPQWVVLDQGAAWPRTLSGVNAVEITFTTGYASAPPQLAQAVRMLVALWFEQRVAGDVPSGVLSLIEPYRTGWFAA